MIVRILGLLTLTSCVATRGDLIDLSDDLNQALKVYDEKAEAAATQDDLDAALAELLEQVSSDVDDTIETIEERVEDVQETAQLVAEKASQGPQGWLELLLAGAGMVGAGGVALNRHRNGTRARDIKEANS